MSTTLTRTTPACHPTPSYRVSLNGELIGRVTRYGVSEPKRGRWVHRGMVVRIYWAAEDSRGYTRLEKGRTRAAAVAYLVGTASHDARPEEA